MKKRILTGWTLTRVIYLALGFMVIIQAAMIKNWIGVLFGSYFASMGLFAYGCAAGNCFGGNCSPDSKEKPNTSIDNVEYEEVKAK